MAAASRSCRIRLNIQVDGAPQDGTLRERNVVTGTDGTASTIYTAPPIPANGVFANNCGGSTLGTCVKVVATPTSSNFGTVNPERSDSPRPDRRDPAARASAGRQLHLLAGDAAGQRAGAVRRIRELRFAAAGRRLPVDGANITVVRVEIRRRRDAHRRHCLALVRTAAELHRDPDGHQQHWRVQLEVTGNHHRDSGPLPTASFSFSPASPGVGDRVSSTASRPRRARATRFRRTPGIRRRRYGRRRNRQQCVCRRRNLRGDIDRRRRLGTRLGGADHHGWLAAWTGANFTFSPSRRCRSAGRIRWRSTTTAQGQTIVSLDWNFGDTAPVVTLSR